MTTTTPTGAALAITGIDQFGVSVTPGAAVSVSIAGASVAEVWDYSVEDIIALAVARPDPLEIVPRRAAILRAIKDGPIPGLLTFSITRVTARAN